MVLGDRNEGVDSMGVHPLAVVFRVDSFVEVLMGTISDSVDLRDLNAYGTRYTSQNPNAITPA